MAKKIITTTSELEHRLRYGTTPCRLEDLPSFAINGAIRLLGADHGIASTQIDFGADEEIQGFPKQGSWFILNLDSFGPKADANIKRLLEAVGDSPDFRIVKETFDGEVEGYGYAVFANPIVKASGRKFTHKEGCTSILDENGRPRTFKVRRRKVVHLTMRGRKDLLEVSLLDDGSNLTKCFQHEDNHLKGILIDGKPSMSA